MDKTGFIRQFNVTAYTLQGCVHCMHLHELLERSSIPEERITYVDVGTDISKEDFISEVKPKTRKASEIINNQEAEKQANYCYKPYRTLRNY